MLLAITIMDTRNVFFWFGLVNPHFLSAMYTVRDFLEEMDEKYHYLSSNGTRQPLSEKEND